MRKSLLKLSLVALLFAAGSNAMAADYRQNPYTLAYDNAITQNVAGKVNIQQVRYLDRGVEIAANVYLPANFDPNKKYPAIVVVHPNGGVKEQVAGLYAQKLAEQGYITIAADAAYQGASGGLPRGLDDPNIRSSNVSGAADFLDHFKGVDPDRIGVLGICAGGGYTLKATQTDKRFKAVATLSMFDTGQARRGGLDGSLLPSLPERLKAASEARAKEAEGGDVQYNTYVAEKREDAMKVKSRLYREGWDYYRDTHFHPNSTNKYTTSSLINLASFDPIRTNMDLIDQPLLLIAGEVAETRPYSEQAFKNATGTNNKELYLVKGASHMQTYFVPEYVNEIMNKLDNFYGKNL